jgi:hypothetical protein
LKEVNTFNQVVTDLAKSFSFPIRLLQTVVYCSSSNFELKKSWLFLISARSLFDVLVYVVRRSLICLDCSFRRVSRKACSSELTSPVAMLLSKSLFSASDPTLDVFCFRFGGITTNQVIY